MSKSYQLIKQIALAGDQNPIAVGVVGTKWNYIRSELIAMAHIVEKSHNKCGWVVSVIEN